MSDRGQLRIFRVLSFSHPTIPTANRNSQERAPLPGLGPIRSQGAIATGYTEPKFFPAEAARDGRMALR